MNSLKKHFLLDPNVVFLNHGSFGATPKPVFREYQRWQRELEKQPVEFLGRRFTQLMAESRAALGNYLGTHADNLVYTQNVTISLNIVARSLGLGNGDEVLSTDHEYGAIGSNMAISLQRTRISICQSGDLNAYRNRRKFC